MHKHRVLLLTLSTSLGESNSHTNVQSTAYDAAGQTSLAQTIQTKSTTKTVPTLSGDLRYSLTLPRGRTSYISYRYDDTHTEMTQLRSIFETSSMAQPADEPYVQRDQRLRSHSVLWHDVRRIGKPAPDDPYHGFFGPSLTLGATYTHRNNEDMTQYADAPSRIDGLDYRQHVAGFRPNFIYRAMKWQASAGVSIEYENDKGTFRNTGTPLDYAQFALNPSCSVSLPYTPISISYTEQSVRPSFNRLNPYVDDSDPMNLYAGNPELTSEKVRRVSLLVLHTISNGPQAAGMITLASGIKLDLSYEIITHAIEQVSTVSGDGISMTTFENIGKREKYKIGFASDYSPVKIFNLNLSFGYGFLRYHSPNPNVDGNRAAGWDGNVMLSSSRLWPGGSTSVSYQLVPGMDMSQVDKIFYNHYFNFVHSQALIKSKLFASVEISNPFASRITVRNSITGTNFRMDTARERLGRIFKFTVRWNFGRLKDRVAEAQKMEDDTSRD